ncbi:MAG: transposase family protein [Myxococcales bacterium]|nr:transposase family protein [Myxococcales bacterium]
MARATKAQKIEIENEQAALQFFERMLAGLTDPRRPQGLRYPLRSVVLIALMSMVCSCDNAESMELWGYANAFKPKTMQTRVGEMTVRVPQTRGWRRCTFWVALRARYPCHPPVAMQYPTFVHAGEPCGEGAR